MSNLPNRNIKNIDLHIEVIFLRIEKAWNQKNPNILVIK